MCQGVAAECGSTGIVETLVGRMVHVGHLEFLKFSWQWTFTVDFVILGEVLRRQLVVAYFFISGSGRFANTAGCCRRGIAKVCRCRSYIGKWQLRGIIYVSLEVLCVTCGIYIRDVLRHLRVFDFEGVGGRFAFVLVSSWA